LVPRRNVFDFYGRVCYLVPPRSQVIDTWALCGVCPIMCAWFADHRNGVWKVIRSTCEYVAQPSVFLKWREGPDSGRNKSASAVRWSHLTRARISADVILRLGSAEWPTRAW